MEERFEAYRKECLEFYEETKKYVTDSNESIHLMNKWLFDAIILDFSDLGLKKLPHINLKDYLVFDFQYSINISLDSNNIKNVEDLKINTESFKWINLSLGDNQIKSLKGVNFLRYEVFTLDLTCNQIKSLKDLPEDLSNVNNLTINLMYNKIKSLKGIPFKIPKEFILNLPYNQITSLKGIPSGLTNGMELDLSHNLIETVKDLPVFENNILVSIDLQYNPLYDITHNKGTKVSVNVRNTVYQRSLPYKKYSQEVNFKGKTYEIITLKKGTALFRETHSIEQIKESFVGFKKDTYYNYPPQHRVYAMGEPYYSATIVYGNFQTCWVLTKDVTLLIGDGPNTPSELQEVCDSDYIRINDDDCFNTEFKKLYNVTGILAQRLYVSLDKRYNPLPESLSHNISIYSRKIPSQTDIKTPVEEYDSNPQLWYETHLDEFAMKPLFILDMEKYSVEGAEEFFEKFMSPSGYTDESGKTYYLTYRDNMYHVSGDI